MNTNKNLEISLYAHLKKQDYARFINILTSICGAQYKKFQEYEMGLLPIIQTPPGPARNDDIMIRLRGNYTHASIKYIQKWQLLHFGKPDERFNSLYNVRTVTDSLLAGNNIHGFVGSLGFHGRHEFVRKGVIYHYNHALIIKVYEIYKVAKRMDLKSISPLDSANSYVVEVCTRRVSQDEVARAGQELLNFKQKMEGVIDLAPIDHNILAHSIRYQEQKNTHN